MMQQRREDYFEDQVVKQRMGLEKLQPKEPLLLDYDIQALQKGDREALVCVHISIPGGEVVGKPFVTSTGCDQFCTDRFHQER